MGSAVLLEGTLPKTHPQNRECPNGERHPGNAGVRSYQSLCRDETCGYCGPRLARELAFLIGEAVPTHLALVRMSSVRPDERAGVATRLLKRSVVLNRDMACCAHLRGSTAIILIRGRDPEQALSEAAADLDLNAEVRKITNPAMAAHNVMKDLVGGIDMPYQEAVRLMETAVSHHGTGRGQRGKLVLTYGKFWLKRDSRSARAVSLSAARSWIRGGRWPHGGHGPIIWRTYAEAETAGQRFDPRTQRWVLAATD